MRQDEIIRMAREAGLHLYVNDLTKEPYALVVERFANLVAAAEREACAAMFDDRNVWDEEVGERIRARGNT